MQNPKMIEAIERRLRTLSKILIVVGSSFLLIQTGLTVSNIAGRYLLKEPIKPTYELMCLLMILVLSLSWAYTTYVKGHISVDIFEASLPARIRKTRDILVSLLTLMSLVLLIWGLYKAGIQFHRLGLGTDLLMIQFWPFAFLMAFGLLLSAVVAFFQLIQAISKATKEEP